MKNIFVFLLCCTVTAQAGNCITQWCAALKSALETSPPPPQFTGIKIVATLFRNGAEISKIEEFYRINAQGNLYHNKAETNESSDATHPITLPQVILDPSDKQAIITYSTPQDAKRTYSNAHTLTFGTAYTAALNQEMSVKIATFVLSLNTRKE